MMRDREAMEGSTLAVWEDQCLTANRCGDFAIDVGAPAWKA